MCSSWKTSKKEKHKRSTSLLPRSDDKRQHSIKHCTPQIPKPDSSGFQHALPTHHRRPCPYLGIGQCSRRAHSHPRPLRTCRRRSCGRRSPCPRQARRQLVPRHDTALLPQGTRNELRQGQGRGAREDFYVQELWRAVHQGGLERLWGDYLGLHSRMELLCFRILY